MKIPKKIRIAYKSKYSSPKQIAKNMKIPKKICNAYESKCSSLKQKAKEKT